jgi:hypothetical protein
VHFFLFWCHAPRKIWQPWSQLITRNEGSFVGRKKNFFFLKVKQRRERIELGRRKEESSGKKKRRATSYDAILVPSRYIDPRSVSHLHTQVGIVMPGYKILHPGLKLLCVLGKNCHAQV